MSKELSPIAAAIIGALLPFVNEEDKQGLNATFATLKSTAAEATAKMQEQVAAATSETETSTGENTVWSLASCGGFYIPFDDRIHGQTKDDNGNDIPKITAKDQFAKKRGVNPKEFNEIEGQIVDEFGKDKTEFELIDGQPVAIGGTGETETTEEAPQRPVRHGGNAEKPQRPGGVPQRPVRPGGNAEKPAEDADRKAALASINQLTKDYNVNYDFLTEQLLQEHGVDNFQDLAPEFNKTVARDSKAWVDFLNLIAPVNQWFLDMDEKHNETSHDMIKELLTEYGVENIGELARDQLSVFHTTIEEIQAQWEPYFTDLDNQ